MWIWRLSKLCSFVKLNKSIFQNHNAFINPYNYFPSRCVSLTIVKRKYIYIQARKWTQALFQSLTEFHYWKWDLLHISWNRRRVYFALIWNAVDFYGAHMAAFYCAQLNCFKLGLTFWSYITSPYFQRLALRLLQMSPKRRSQIRGVKYEAVTTMLSERALPAFNGLTYIPVQRANKGSLV